MLFRNRSDIPDGWQVTKKLPPLSAEMYPEEYGAGDKSAAIKSLSAINLDQFYNPDSGAIQCAREPEDTYFVRGWKDHTRSGRHPIEGYWPSDVTIRVPNMTEVKRAVVVLAYLFDADNSGPFDLLCRELFKHGDRGLFEDYKYFAPLAQSPIMPSDVLFDLAGNDAAHMVAVRPDLAEHPAVLERLVYDSDAEVRSYIMGNESCPQWARTIAATTMTVADTA